MFCDAVSDADTQKGTIPSKSVKQQIIVNIRFIFLPLFLINSRAFRLWGRRSFDFFIKSCNDIPILELSFPPVIKQNISQNAHKSKYNCGDYKTRTAFRCLNVRFTSLYGSVLRKFSAMLCGVPKCFSKSFSVSVVVALSAKSSMSFCSRCKNCFFFFLSHVISLSIRRK